MNLLQRHTSLSDGVSVLGQQIQAVALAYAAHAARNNWTEQTQNNTDPFIRALWECYAPGRKLDTTAAGSYNNAYCVVGMSTIVSDAVDCFKRAGTPGAVNVLPGYSQTYGNAKTLRDKARMLPNFTDTTPAIGAGFYRASTGSASGHCGVIVGLEYNSSGQLALVRTVESNASLAGATTQYGFLVVEYTPTSPFWIGNASAEWTILHTERMFTAATPVQDCTTTCLNISIPLPSATSTTTTSEPVREDGGTTRREQRTTPTEAITATGAATKTKKPQHQTDVTTPPCRDTYIERSCCEDGKTTLRPVVDANLRHYSTLRNKTVATDYIQLQIYPDKPFRMVTDNAGNRYFIAVESVKETWDIPREMGIFGNYLVVPISRTEAGWTGGNSDDGMAGFLGTYSSKRPNELLRKGLVARHGLRASTYTVYAGVDKGKQLLEKPAVAEGTLRDLVDIIWSDVTTYGDLMQRIEENSTRRGSAYPENFVFLFTGQPTSVAQGLANAVEVAAPLILGALGSAGIQIADSTRSLVQTMLPSVLRGQFNLAHAGQLIQLGRSLLSPDYQPLADKAQRILTSVATRQFGAETGQDALAILRAVDSELGIGLAPRVDALFSGVQQQIDAHQLLYANAAAEIRRVANSVKGDVERTAQVFSNALTSFNLGNLVSVGTAFDDPNWIGKTLFSRIVEATSAIDVLDRAPTIVRDARLREMILSTDTLQALGAMPGFHAIAKGIMSVPTVYREMIQSTADHYTWAAIAMGNRLGEDALLRVQLDALSRKAIEFRDRGWQFSLPAIFQGEKRECISREIELCTGISCCPPKVMFQGACVDPSQVPDTPGTPDTKPVAPDTSKQNSIPALDLNNLPTVWGTVTNATPGYTFPTKPAPTQPPLTLVLPSCIRQESSGYVYCPPLTCSIVPTGSTSSNSLVGSSAAKSGTSTLAPSSVVPVTTVSAPVVPSAPVVSSAPIVPSAPVTVLSPPVTPAVVKPATIAPATILPATSSAILPAPTVLPATTVVPAATPAASVVSVAPASALYSKKLSDGVCYPARVVYPGTPMEVWFAEISGVWVEIIDCCPSREEDCCTDNKSRIARIEERISKLYEMLLRNDAGEQNTAVDFAALRSEILTLRSYVESLPRAGAYDDRAVRQELSRLESLIIQLQQARSNVQPYDDTELRTTIQTLESRITRIIEQMAALHESQSTTGTSYDDRSLRAELARQAAELQQLHSSLYAGPQNEQETAILKQQVSTLQRAVERLQASVTESRSSENSTSENRTSAPTQTSTQNNSSGNIAALQAELALVRRNMEAMQAGYEQNIAMLLAERTDRQSSISTPARDEQLYSEVERLREELGRQVRLYEQKIDEKSGEVKRAVRQQYNVQTQPPPIQPGSVQKPAVQRSAATSWGSSTDGTTGNCPDCPAMVETHTRIINRYPQHPKQCCD